MAFKSSSERSKKLSVVIITDSVTAVNILLLVTAVVEQNSKFSPHTEAKFGSF